MKNLDDAAQQQEDQASCTSDHLHRTSPNQMMISKGTAKGSPESNLSATPRQDIHGILSQIESEEINQHRSADALSTGEFISLEHLDKLILQNVRTEFYKFNTHFEQILKFKPIRKIQLSSIDINLEKSYQSLQSLHIDDRIHSFEDRIRKLELELDLKDYYDIKRPTVVFFSNPTQSTQ